VSEMEKPMELWIIKVFRRLGSEADESELTEIPVPDGRWPVVTRAILGAWREEPVFQVRADVYGPSGDVVAQFSFDELDYPDTDGWDLGV